MNSLLALVAWGALGSATLPLQTPTTGSGIVAEGKPVALTFPQPKTTAVSADLVTWHGWGYLAGAKPSMPQRFDVGYRWPATEEATKAASPLVWHEKIVIFTRSDQALRDRDGVLQEARHTIESEALQQTEESVARVVSRITSEVGGAIRVEPEIDVDREPIRAESFGPDFARSYFAARINGGGYEAEDKIFRGPFHGAIYVLPGAMAAPTPLAVVNGTPILGIARESLQTPFSPTELDFRLAQAWIAEVKYRLCSRLLNVQVGGKPVDWAEAADVSDLPTAVRLERLSAPPAVGVISESQLFPVPVKAFSSAATEVTLVTDADRGQILHVAEKGVGRNGAVAFPVRDDGAALGSISKTPTLSMDVRSASHDPIGIEVVGGKGKSQFFSLGRDRYSVDADSAIAVPFANDGKWQHVTLDLKRLAEVAGSDEITGIVIKPTPASVMAGRIQAEPIEADFDQVKFSDEAPAPALSSRNPDAASTDPVERAMFAAKATESSPALVALLADKSDLVRLNACDAYTRLTAPAALAGLTSDVNEIDPTISATALLAVMHQGGDAALTTVIFSVHHGITEFTRETAARILGATKDPKYGNDIVELLADRSRRCRLASVEALSNIPGRGAAIDRLAFIEQVDPDIKLAVTRSCDPADEYQMRKLLWSAVNEPSDLVRAESDIKLIQSSDAAFRSEGYKGVRDDSRLTRLILLKYFAEHPAEAHRGALRLAVADRSAEVRAAALRGFAALDKGAQADEIANTLEDRDPEVQLALIDLAKRRGLKLTDQTRAAMAASPDERVRTAIKEVLNIGQ